MKLSKILKELLDPKSSEAYDVQGPKVASHSFSDGSIEKNYKWTYKNVKGQKMDIEINLTADSENKENAKMILSFGKSTSSSMQSKYSTMTGAGDLKKIIKTVIDAAEYIIAKELPDSGKNGLHSIGFEPADERRDRIYTYIIQNYFPEFKQDESWQDKGFTFKWFENQNYQPPQTKTSSED